VIFQPQVTSPLDARHVRDSREVGTAAAFERRLAGRTLSFTSSAPGSLVDLQTGSRWDITGRAITGPLRGAQLRRSRFSTPASSQACRSPASTTRPA
jgi:hypothetical protein